MRDESRGDIAWSKVLKLLVTNCLIDPASEFYVHRQWFDKTAMDELLDTDYQIASKDRLYRCLDRILDHRVWVMDRGIPTEEVLSQMRDENIQYLVGTPRAKLARLEDKLVDLDWKTANENVSVKLLSEDKELYVLAKSKDRRAKERSMRKYRLRKYLVGLEKLRKNCRNRDKLIERLGALKQQAGRSEKCVDLTIPPGQAFTVGSFKYKFNRAAYRKMLLRDGLYLLRTNLTETEPDIIWQRYILLTQVEAAFKSLKSDMAVHPVRHQLEHRVEAHIFVAIMGYCLMVTLR